jgi:hypothetical protein
MKKVFALAFVAGMVTLASCGEKKTEAAADTTVVADTATVAADTAAVAADTAAADTTKK